MDICCDTYSTLYNVFYPGAAEKKLHVKKRLGEATVETPEEKHLRFLNEEPQLLQRLPLFQIAAYPGITPETLKGTRKKITQK